jgi:hypothetical protein
MDARLHKVASVDAVEATDRARAPRRSPFARMFTDREGDLRTAPLIGIVMAAAFIIGIGTYAGLLAADAGSPGTLVLWVVAALLLIKLPLLAVMWWVISRRRDPAGGGGWSSKECRQILAYLEEQARESAGRPDAATRLAYFAREAWFVADRATDADTPAAVDTAVLIEAMAAEAGAPVDRSRADRPGGGTATA